MGKNQNNQPYFIIFVKFENVIGSTLVLSESRSQKTNFGWNKTKKKKILFQNT